MGYYQEPLSTVEEAVKNVRLSDRVVFSHAYGEPRVLPGALVKRAGELRKVEIVLMVPRGEALYGHPEYALSFRQVTFFSGVPTRETICENRADYLPWVFREIPFLFESVLPPDVALVTVSPPDKNGLCSLGVSVDYTKKAVEMARMVMAEVNPTLPRTHGESFVSLSDIHYFVEVMGSRAFYDWVDDHPMIEMHPVDYTNNPQVIARNKKMGVEYGFNPHFSFDD